MKKPHCPKNHRFRPISFNEKTGAAVYACKCGIQWKRQAKFVCREPRKAKDYIDPFPRDCEHGIPDGINCDDCADEAMNDQDMKLPDRRVELIQKQNTGGLTASEHLELGELNAKADQEIHKILGPINAKLSELVQHKNELQTLQLCSCGKAPECLPGRHFRQVACRRCGRRGPLAPDEDLAIQLWNNDRCFISPLGYEHAITVGWNEHNARRHALIELKRSRALFEDEAAELAELQWIAGIKRELANGPIPATNDFPTPTATIQRLDRASTRAAQKLYALGWLRAAPSKAQAVIFEITSQELEAVCVVTSDGYHRWNAYANGTFCDFCGAQQTDALRARFDIEDADVDQDLERDATMKQPLESKW